MVYWGAYKNYSALPLRLALGIVFIMHGAQKVFGAFGGPGLDGTAQFIGSLGFPAPIFFGYLLAFVELIGGLAILLGFFARYAAMLIAVDMIIAFLLVHVKNGFFMSTGGYEFVFTLFFASIALVLIGSQKYSLDKLLFKKDF